MYDVAIIGAGVVGCALAYTLSQYQVSVLLIEKENDVAMGASRANTAIIHAGFDPPPESLMGQLNVEGMHRCYELCRELDVEHRQTGSLVLAFDASQRLTLEELYRQGLANGCAGLEIISGDQARQREPRLSPDLVAALWAPEAGVINPWDFALAMAEVALRNGVIFMPDSRVTAIRREPGFYRMGFQDSEEEIKARYVVNAAGLESGLIHDLVAEPSFQIQPTRGEYYLLDRTAGPLIQSIIFHCPTEHGKGVTVSPTIHDNFLVGPNSQIIDDPDDTGVTRAGLDHIGEIARKMVPSLPLNANIRNFAGVRANSDRQDFVIGLAAENFLDLAAIKSPGLTSAPAIARLGRDLLSENGLDLKKKEVWEGGRRVIRFKEIPEDQKEAFVRDNPLYGRVICRCETITEGELVACMKSPIPPVSIDGVKRRTGSGLGRCQGGFCGPRVLEILARESGRQPLEIEEDGRGSRILTRPTKEGCPRD
ncbi:MAG: NAD(P)/FAD-dependent oxidoreductase [Saccharofermentanales bacterium]